MTTRVKQRDITDCGAACLASVAAHYKLNLPVSKIRQYASTDKKGTNVLGMTEAAQKLGFDAKGVKGPFDSLFKIPLPAIAHVVVKEVLHHFVVIYKANAKHITVMDPADGQLHQIKHEDFKKEWSGVLILLLPNQDFKPADEKITVRARFWQLIKPERSVLAQALLGAMVYTILGLSTSIYVQKIVDNVLTGGNTNLLNMMGVVMLVLVFFQLFIGSVKSVFTLKTGQVIDARLILGYYKHLLKLPQQFFDTMRVGEITSRINDAVKIRVFINDVSINLAVNVFIVIFSFAMMFTYYWKLALIILISLPLYLLVYVITNKINKKVQRKLMESGAELESQLLESLNAINTIKQFGLEEHANNTSDIRFTALLKLIYKSSITSLYSGNSTDTISKIFTIVLLWAGATFVLNNQLTPGELLSFYTLSGYFTGPVSSLIGMNKTVQDAIIAGDRLFEIMDLERESQDNPHQITAQQIGDIVFKDVCFRYGSRVTVFEKLNLTIPKGKFTAIVGESGSGKTTLMALMQNLYPLQSGHIFFGDYDIKYINNAALRASIGVVPQKVDLFAGSVLDNIAIGDYQPDMQRIIKITQQLGISNFIETLPNGYGTYIGENGVALSGGQRQRLAIARALYRQPEILLFDEATSALDSTSEQYVSQALQYQLAMQKTVVVIAHRLSTIYKADKIIVLDKGTLAEEGTHQQLMALKGKYYHLCMQQAAPNI
jgi:ATP-binding cassette, subfamily C, bacteriocin exporter